MRMFYAKKITFSYLIIQNNQHDKYAKFDGIFCEGCAYVRNFNVLKFPL